MDKLKQFIDTHREAFDDDFLPEGHLERFEKKLASQSPEVTKKPLAVWLRVLAVAAAAAIAVFVFIEIRSGIGDAPVQQTETYMCETQMEIDELRTYYNMQMDELYAQIRALYKMEQAPGGLELLEETKQVIKTSQDFEDNILPHLPCSEAGLFAMNQHYNTSIQSLAIMLKQMEHTFEYNNQ